MMTANDREPNFQKGCPTCLPPPITEDSLLRYQHLLDGSAVPPPIDDAMQQLIDMVSLFLETPRSTLPAETVPTNFFDTRNATHIRSVECTPLEPAEVARLWDAVPWHHELNAMGELFGTIDSGAHKPLRKAAFHLLWYGRELLKDREPITNDRV